MKKKPVNIGKSKIGRLSETYVLNKEIALYVVLMDFFIAEIKVCII